MCCSGKHSEVKIFVVLVVRETSHYMMCKVSERSEQIFLDERVGIHGVVFDEKWIQ